jgi:ribose 5-phosphate isomerase B
MKIAIDCDDAAVELKDIIYDHIKSKGIEIDDLKSTRRDPAMYPEIGYNLGKKIQDKTYDRGILLCGTGLGMAMVANKVEGVFAGTCHDVYSAERLKKSNDAQVITMGARVVGSESTAKVEQMRELEKKSFNS